MAISNEEIDFTVERIEKTSIFEKEISFLEKEGAVLLGAIQILEEYLNLKKKRKKEKKVTATDIREMQELIVKFFHILSLIDAFQLFESEKSMLTDENINSFISIVSNSYSIRFKKFVNDLELSLEK